MLLHFTILVLSTADGRDREGGQFLAGVAGRLEIRVGAQIAYQLGRVD